MSGQDYNLGRHYVASGRLNMMHWLSNYRKGYLVHPAIHLGENAAIADVGAGTGAWLLEVAHNSPSTRTFDAFDIDLAQLPNEKWLPKNIRTFSMDLWRGVPAPFQKKYDLVHLSHFSNGFRGQDITFLVEQVKGMLKDGGWIQWTEPDLLGDKIVRASDDVKIDRTVAMHKEVSKLLEPRLGKFPGWHAKLPEIFDACGITDVRSEYQSPPSELLPAVHDCFLQGWRELLEKVSDPAELLALHNEAVAEFAASKRGLAVKGTILTVVGRVLRS